VQELLKNLVGNFTVLKRLKEFKRESKRSFLDLSLKQFTLKLPQTINSVDVLYNFSKWIPIDLRNT